MIAHQKRISSSKSTLRYVHVEIRNSKWVSAVWEVSSNKGAKASIGYSPKRLVESLFIGRLLQANEAIECVLPSVRPSIQTKFLVSQKTSFSSMWRTTLNPYFFRILAHVLGSDVYFLVWSSSTKDKDRFPAVIQSHQKYIESVLCSFEQMQLSLLLRFSIFINSSQVLRTLLSSSVKWEKNFIKSKSYKQEHASLVICTDNRFHPGLDRPIGSFCAAQSLKLHHYLFRVRNFPNMITQWWIIHHRHEVFNYVPLWKSVLLREAVQCHHCRDKHLPISIFANYTIWHWKTLYQSLACPSLGTPKLQSSFQIAADASTEFPMKINNELPHSRNEVVEQCCVIGTIELKKSLFFY